MIIIKIPSNNVEERKYIIDVIFKYYLGIEYVFQTGEQYRSTEICCDNGSSVIIEDHFFNMFTKDLEYLNKKNIPENITYYKGDNIIEESVPIIYGKPRLEIKNSHGMNKISSIMCGIDIFASCFFMLTRWEELVSNIRDVHNRFPAKASLAYKNGFLNLPVVDEYVEILWTCMKRLMPGLEREKNSYHVYLSHDVDVPLAVLDKPWRNILRSTIGDIVKRWNFSLAMRRIKTKIKQDYDNDPYNSFNFIMNFSEKSGLKSTFYFKAGCTNPCYDTNYSLDNEWIQKLMVSIYERGHEIGLHPSYESFNNYKVMKAEYENFFHTVEKLGIKQTRWGSRQHYLRWENPTTWQILNDIGIDYDTTLGYADQVGFRCGTCREFPVFNVKTRKRLTTFERPLIIMEGTLLGDQYMGLNPEQTVEKIKQFADICRKYNGNFTLLWHNSYLIDEKQKQLYMECIEVII